MRDQQGPYVVIHRAALLLANYPQIYVWGLPSVEEELAAAGAGPAGFEAVVSDVVEVFSAGVFEAASVDVSVPEDDFSAFAASDPGAGVLAVLDLRESVA
jgi:hypothetical protein